MMERIEFLKKSYELHKQLSHEAVKLYNKTKDNFFLDAYIREEEEAEFIKDDIEILSFS